RSSRHGLQGSRCRPDQAERFHDRTADSTRRANRCAHQGGAVVSVSIHQFGKAATVSGTPRLATRLPWSFALFFSLLGLVELPAAEITPTKAEPFDILYLSD